MNIVILQGSPNRDGSTAIPAEEFARGSRRTGHEVGHIDVDALATPLYYYYGMSAQLKAVIDRFCAHSSAISARRLDAVLLAVVWSTDDWTFDALEAFELGASL